jgi:hypothetical protein
MENDDLHETGSIYSLLAKEIIIFTIVNKYVGVKGVVCGPEGTHLAGGCVLSKLG